MRTARFLAITILAGGLAVMPAYGGSAEPGDRPLSERLDEIFRDLMEQMKPALDELLETLKVLEGIDDFEYYQRPEILPNGDIIIRRREDAPPYQHPLPDDDGGQPGDEPAATPGIRT